MARTERESNNSREKRSSKHSQRQWEWKFHLVFCHFPLFIQVNESFIIAFLYINSNITYNQKMIIGWITSFCENILLLLLLYIPAKDRHCGILHINGQLFLFPLLFSSSSFVFMPIHNIDESFCWCLEKLI